MRNELTVLKNAKSLGHVVGGQATCVFIQNERILKTPALLSKANALHV